MDSTSKNELVNLKIRLINCPKIKHEKIKYIEDFYIYIYIYLPCELSGGPVVRTRPLQGTKVLIPGQRTKILQPGESTAQNKKINYLPNSGRSQTSRK